MQNSASDGSSAEGGAEKLKESGFDMFGFSNPEILRLVQVCLYILPFIDYQKVDLVCFDLHLYQVIPCIQPVV